MIQKWIIFPNILCRFRAPCDPRKKSGVPHVSLPLRDVGFLVPKEQLPTSRKRREKWGTQNLSVIYPSELIQKILPVQGIPLRRTEPGIANNPPQLFFGRAVGHARSAYDVLFQHHRAHIVPTKAQAHLADF